MNPGELASGHGISCDLAPLTPVSDSQNRQPALPRLDDNRDKSAVFPTELEDVPAPQVDRRDEPAERRVAWPKHLRPAVVGQPDVGDAVKAASARVIEKGPAGAEP